LSNRTIQERVDLVDELMVRPLVAPQACHQALRVARQPCIRDRVDVEELAARFADGDMIKELARQHSISESSVKRLLRATGVRRGQGST
jgi:hypothetical protein